LLLNYAQVHNDFSVLVLFASDAFYVNSAYFEGSGLYVESIRKELRRYNDPFWDIQAASDEIHRTIGFMVGHTVALDLYRTSVKSDVAKNGRQISKKI
jgi:hypothetical protein